MGGRSVDRIGGGLMPPRHCAACGGFLDRAGRCGTRHCGNFRGRPAAPRPEPPAASVPAASTPAVAIVLPPVSTGEPERTVEKGEPSWLQAVAVAAAEPSPRPGPDGRCPTCGQPEAATLTGALGLHVCRGDVAAGVRAFLGLVGDLVGNF